jgi:hypothetical protein
MRRSFLAALPSVFKLCLVCGLVALAVLPARAVTVIPLSFEELVRQSSSVVYARVIEVRGQWTDDRRSIDSLVTVEVIKGLKGTSATELTVTIPGGQVGRYVNLLPGAPALSRGDLAVLFLTARGPRLPITTGFTQGIYRVSRDGASGAALVTPPAVELGARPIVRGDSRRKPVSLAAFEGAVRSAQGGAQ